MWSSGWLPLFFTETARPQLDSFFFFFLPAIWSTLQQY